jgi:alpha-glucosidase
MFQGDEIGMTDGSGSDPPLDRAGRDRFRHPMQWDATPGGGFAAAKPWLALTDPAIRNVADQSSAPHSTLSLYRRLIALRSQLTGGARLHDSPAGTIVLERGRHVIAVNLSAEPRALDLPSRIIAEARPGDGSRPGRLPGRGGVIAVD